MLIEKPYAFCYFLSMIPSTQPLLSNLSAKFLCIPFYEDTFLISQDNQAYGF